ncbi:RHS repeat protein [Pseudomonas cichorii]|uniref:RHS repeat protein n=2 Tax=Pseudomonas lijiangensis TaxID=2995658 RepID=A0ABX8HYJ4_9PSED|nr:RHS repeat protein [Pseudomonas cichorii]MBX8500173.1 RHS repeat protein [Pseudomonas lijiangensis]MBX8505424.1 RHS repeat protein [Pseudomonas lijiangensis]QWU85725.1 RHS repeat protein [Pseudomonas lijiangensis]
MYNVSTAKCGNDEQKGAPLPESCVGNPISLAVGNKFQLEVDYKAQGVAPVFTRAYNSLDGLWRHNYSAFIRFAIGKLSLVHADGRESFFSVEGDIATAYPTETGLLVKTGDNWLYTADNNERFTFDARGRLIEWIDAAGLRLQLTYANDQVTVTSDSGQSLIFTEDTQHQPLSLVAPGLQISYSYDSNKHLVQLNRTRGSQTEQRQFHYEDSRNTGLLTGITDERGVRFATWSYDDQGRAVSSQHSGGAGLTQVVYNTDDSRTVTNELGKTTTYRYQQIGGIKRVISIEGEPSPNCPASNSSYTYNERGLVLSKTDAKGSLTTYTYNSRGLETSRTEASGTAVARTITTEWDSEQFLPTRIVEPTRVTVYRYDDQGRELSRQVTTQ